METISMDTINAELSDVLSGSIMNLVGYNHIETDYLEIDKESKCTFKLKIKPNESTFIPKNIDVVEPKYLICSNDDFNKLEYINVHYDYIQTDAIPKWLIDCLIGKDINEKIKQLKNGRIAVPLDFMHKMIIMKGDVSIKLEFKGTITQEIYMSMIGTQLNTESRKNCTIDHGIYQYYSMIANGNKIKEKVKFRSIGTDLIIHCKEFKMNSELFSSNFIDIVKTIRIYLNGHMCLKYDEVDIELYAKRYANSLHIFYNYMNDQGWNCGINYGMVEFTVEIEFYNDITDGVIQLATNTYNKTIHYEGIPTVQFNIPINKYETNDINVNNYEISDDMTIEI